MPRIHTLILNDSQVQDWQSIDNLQSTFGSTLKTFKYSVAKELQNEVLALQDAVKRKLFQGRLDDRVFLIAKLEGLETLNGTPVTKQERTDAERFYLTQAIKEFGPDAKDIPAWGRLKELKEKHGTSDIVAARPSTNMTLKSKMIDISIEAPDLGAELFTISILPTAPLKLLKTKIARHLGVPTNASLILTVLEASNGERREVQVDGRATVASLELTGQDTILVVIV
ncbi:hypothetical protein QFC19_002654 [Naganishia cerealis]|uniref:Uncharacterized protein n=1 Tax=Naganishia cerealis TaxID=610337 RepID=A0ACC2WA24_9TREE|nr:hypothetical protein QFC19_002654 [Naganishia cerealis]